MQIFLSEGVKKETDQLRKTDCVKPYLVMGLSFSTMQNRNKCFHKMNSWFYGDFTVAISTKHYVNICNRLHVYLLHKKIAVKREEQIALLLTICTTNSHINSIT